MATWLDGTSGSRTASTLEGMFAYQIAPFSFSGPLVVVTGTSRFRFPLAVTLVAVSAAVTTAPTGASILVDVNKNGTTIYTTQANRPAIAVSTNAGAETTPDVTAIAAGDYLTVDVDQVGSTIAGADLSVFVRYRYPSP